jgi:hypothetical protein
MKNQNTARFLDIHKPRNGWWQYLVEISLKASLLKSLLDGFSECADMAPCGVCGQNAQTSAWEMRCEAVKKDFGFAKSTGQRKVGRF